MMTVFKMLVYIIILFLWRDIVRLQFVVPFDIMFFLIDFVFVLLIIVNVYLPDKQYSIFDPKKFNIISIIILMILAIIILWQHWDVAKDMVIFSWIVEKVS